MTSAATLDRIALALMAVYLVAAAALAIARRPQARAGRPFTLPELVVIGLLLAVAAELRFGHVTTLHNGRLTQDEAAITRDYVAAIVNWEPVVTGASYLTHAWLLDGWYALAGVGTYSARWYTATGAAIGLVCFFAALRLAANARVAAWATVFLAVATYAVYFSVFALETAGVMLFVPLVLLLAVLWLRRPTVVRSAALGLALAASLFTYPGVALGWTSIVAGCALGWIATVAARRAIRGTGAPLADVPVRSWIAAALPFVAYFAAGAILHRRFYFRGMGFLQGGGSLTMSWPVYRAAIPILARDLFVETTTWNLLFRSVPFVDRILWPFALLGTWVAWRRWPGWVVRGALLSPLVLFFIIPFGGGNPGMRRGIFILFPFCACAGVAVDELAARFGGTVAAVVALVALAQPIWFQATTGRTQWKSELFGADFGAIAIPEDLLLETLRQHDVVLSGEEFVHPWDRARHVDLVRLARRHGVLRDSTHTLRFVAPDDPSLLASVREHPGTVLITSVPAVTVAGLARQTGVCVRIGDLQGDARTVVVHLSAPPDATAGDLCAWSGGEDRAVTTCARLGYRYKLSRLVHEVACHAAACDPNRDEFVFASPGSVRFRLRRPGPPGGPVRLVLGVNDPRPFRRENRIAVDGHDVGRVDGDHVADDRVALDVPPDAGAGDVWTIEVAGPKDPDKIGFDVRWAALQPGTDGGPSGVDCPPILCVRDANGAVCDDGHGPARHGNAG